MKKCQRSVKAAKADFLSQASVKGVVSELIKGDIFETVPQTALQMLVKDINDEDKPKALLPKGSIVILYDGDLDGEENPWVKS